MGEGLKESVSLRVRCGRPGRGNQPIRKKESITCGCFADT